MYRRCCSSLNAHELQGNLSTMNDSYSTAGLIFNAGNTAVMFQISPAVSPHTKHNFLIDEELIPRVDQFAYLGHKSVLFVLNYQLYSEPHLSANCSLRQSDWWRFPNLSINTEVSVYLAICISTLLYCGEVWTLYRRHMHCLETFHIRRLLRIPGTTWKDRIQRAQILQRANLHSIEALVVQGQLSATVHRSRH